MIAVSKTSAAAPRTVRVRELSDAPGKDEEHDRADREDRGQDPSGVDARLQVFVADQDQLEGREGGREQAREADPDLLHALPLVHARSRQPPGRPRRMLAQQLVAALGVARHRAAAARDRRSSPPPRARCGAGSAGRCAGSTAGRSAPRSSSSGASSQSASDTTGSALRRTARAVASRFSVPRFQGQTSWQMSQPYTCAPSSSRYSSGIEPGACVQ